MGARIIDGKAIGATLRAKVAAEGFVGGEFRHGPLELAGPGLTAVLFGPDDPDASPSLRRLGADHPYGDRCYRPGGCAGILRLLAAHIDARQFNLAFPATFPRFVQSAIWRYCAANGLDVCNGNRIDDNANCDNRHCQLFRRCGRVALAPKYEKIT